MPPKKKPSTLAKDFVNATDADAKTEIYNQVEATEIVEFWEAVINETADDNAKEEIRGKLEQAKELRKL
jgi:hypothetical protein